MTLICPKNGVLRDGPGRSSAFRAAVAIFSSRSGACHGLALAFATRKGAGGFGAWCPVTDGAPPRDKAGNNPNPSTLTTELASSLSAVPPPFSTCERNTEQRKSRVVQYICRTAKKNRLFSIFAGQQERQRVPRRRGWSGASCGRGRPGGGSTSGRGWPPASGCVSSRSAGRCLASRLCPASPAPPGTSGAPPPSTGPLVGDREFTLGGQCGCD